MYMYLAVMIISAIQMFKMGENMALKIVFCGSQTLIILLFHVFLASSFFTIRKPLCNSPQTVLLQYDTKFQPNFAHHKERRCM